MVIIGGSGRPNHSKVHSKQHSIRVEHAIGINNTLGDNAILLRSEDDTDTSIVLPIGQQVLSINENDGSTSCVTEFAEAEITCLSLSLDHKYVAVCAACKEGKEHQVAISQHNSRTTAKVIRSKSKNPIQSASFSRNAKLLILASTDSVEVWEWENESLVAKGGIPETQEIGRVQCCPLVFESKLPLITTSGRNHMRLWTALSKDRLSNKSISDDELETNFVDHSWIRCRERTNLVALTLSKTGESTVVVFALVSGMNSNTPIIKETTKISIAVAQPETIVKCICPSEEGFVVAGSHGFIGIFQSDPACSDCNVFSQVKSVCTKLDDEFKCISSQCGSFLFCSKNKKLYTCSLVSLLNDEKADDIIEALNFYDGKIIALSLARARPLMMTAGEDQIVRVW